MYNTIPLFKSHFSLGKSILTLDKPTGKVKSYPTSIFDLAVNNKLETVVLVEDNISGLLQGSKIAAESKLNLIYGIRMDVLDDMNQKDDASFVKRAKYIVFVKSPKGYESLLKIWTTAATKGFYYSPTIDFKTLKSLWNEHLMLAVPFYDSFLHLNALESHAHVPDLDGFGEVVFFSEDNELPFDHLIAGRLQDYCKKNSHSILPAQSIYYQSADDYLAYITFKCLHNRGGAQKATLERPELNHMCSDTFNFDRWLSNNKHE